jgi:hypothetical protein
MRAGLVKSALWAAGGTALWATLTLFVVGPVQARPLLALLQAADRPQDRSRSPEEKRAARAARALSDEQRDAARKIRLAQITLIEQLMQMKPEERQRFLQQNPRIQRMPIPLQRRLQQLTLRLSRLSDEEQMLLLERYRLFLDLPPEKQQQARRVYRHWRMLEPARRRELLREVEQLREASPGARQERLESEQFSKAYSVQEQRILRGLTDLLP